MKFSLSFTSMLLDALGFGLKSITKFNILHGGKGNTLEKK